MKLLTNIKKQPLLQTNDGVIINLNTLMESASEEKTFPVKTIASIKISQHKNNQFLNKAGKCFSVSKVTKNYGTTWYKLESNIVLFCVITGDTMQLIGKYPIYYLKLIYRYINSL